MAKNVTRSAPTPRDDNGGDKPAPWTPPKGDEEFEFTGMNDAPAWVDRGWAGFDRGPALQLPAGDVFQTQPYHTITARIGDKVRWIAPKGTGIGHFEVSPGAAAGPEVGTKKIPQASAASLEDLLKGGFLNIGDLGEDAKAQVAARSPGLARFIEEGEDIAEPQAVSNLIKTA